MTENLRIDEPGSAHDLDEYDWLHWFAGSPMIATDSPPPTRRHAERSEASAVALVCPTTWCDFPRTSLWHLAANFGAASFDSLGPRATTESSDVSSPTRP